MKIESWIKFFDLCNETLGEGSYNLYHSNSWCSWITYDRIIRDASYWSSGLPNKGEYSEKGVHDGGAWRQPFPFKSIAHILIPREFEFCGMYQDTFQHKVKNQDIKSLSEKLKNAGIKHYLSEWALEIRPIDDFS